jgi:transposase InsO family protein
VLRHDRRKLILFGVTSHPTAAWIARQITEAFPWDSAPRYLIRDRDAAYGDIVRQRLRAMGIRDRPIAARPPWQNGCAERLVGPIRRDCLDHMIILGESHLRRILKSYAAYYNELRIHLSLDKDAPAGRPIQRFGEVTAISDPRRTSPPLHPNLISDTHSRPKRRRR